MIKAMKNSVAFYIFSMLAALSLLCSPFAHAAEKDPIAAKAAPIKVIGKTADGKYPVYNLEGELSDTDWKAGGRIYTSGDLMKKLVFLDQADAFGPNHQYECEFVCVDKQKRIVGLNPNFKKLLKQ